MVQIQVHWIDICTLQRLLCQCVPMVSVISWAILMWIFLTGTGEWPGRGRPDRHRRCPGRSNESDCAQRAPSSTSSQGPKERPVQGPVLLPGAGWRRLQGRRTRPVDVYWISQWPHASLLNRSAEGQVRLRVCHSTTYVWVQAMLGSLCFIHVSHLIFGQARKGLFNFSANISWAISCESNRGQVCIELNVFLFNLKSSDRKQKRMHETWWFRSQHSPDTTKPRFMAYEITLTPLVQPELKHT